MKQAYRRYFGRQVDRAVFLHVIYRNGHQRQTNQQSISNIQKMSINVTVSHLVNFKNFFYEDDTDDDGYCYVITFIRVNLFQPFTPFKCQHQIPKCHLLIVSIANRQSLPSTYGLQNISFK